MSNTSRAPVLFIDAYDSFSNNIISLLETTLDVEVITIKIDSIIPDFEKFLQNFVAVVAGPGPGDPRNLRDVGHFRQLWGLEDADLRPVLGICLGFQSLVYAHGGTIQRLSSPRHGLIRTVQSNGSSVFRGISSFETVQYHSLYASLSSQELGKASNRSSVQQTPDLSPIAWENRLHQSEEDGCVGNQNPAEILMAVQHRQKPFIGIQFHLESICSGANAQNLVLNWWRDVCAWRPRNLRSQHIREPRTRRSTSDTKSSRPPLHDVDVNTLGTRSDLSNEDQGSNGFKYSGGVNPNLQDASTPTLVVESRRLDLGDLDVPTICNRLRLCEDECIVLDSERHTNSEIGRFSILAVVEKSSLRLEYFAGSRALFETRDGQAAPVDLKPYQQDPFAYFQYFMDSHRAMGGQQEIPFWGGLIGYITYEGCLQCLEKSSQTTEEFSTGSEEDSARRPDVGFVFVERSIVIDHHLRKIFVQTICPNDESWLGSIVSLLSSAPPLSLKIGQRQSQIPPFCARMSLPDESRYKKKILECKRAICAGDSYEICLTDKATISLSRQLPAWPLYQRLRQINPAPFGAYIRLGRLSLLSSSPERFMRWSRPAVPKGSMNRTVSSQRQKESVLEFRPIKGTVPRKNSTTLDLIGLDEASSILSSPKERAENLMIVDLIRHDLHGVVGSGRVTVPRLMVVEEYETVYQLVSVIEGRLKLNECDDRNSHEQLDVQRLRPTSKRSDAVKANCRNSHRRFSNATASNAGHRLKNQAKTVLSPHAALSATLPPGSMTGAPKLRSCQILQSLEKRPRGVYSGVIGYMDVGGGGDWSVSIRGVVRWDKSTLCKRTKPSSMLGNDQENANLRQRELFEQEGDSDTGDTWTIGAGGAVTALSTEEGEWLEMLTKLQATARLFE